MISNTHAKCARSDHRNTMLYPSCRVGRGYVENWHAWQRNLCVSREAFTSPTMYHDGALRSVDRARCCGWYRWWLTRESCVDVPRCTEVRMVTRYCFTLVSSLTLTEAGLE